MWPPTLSRTKGVPAGPLLVCEMKLFVAHPIRDLGHCAWQCSLASCMGSEGASGCPRLSPTTQEQPLKNPNLNFFPVCGC